jgi:hypothetical protein
LRLEWSVGWVERSDTHQVAFVNMPHDRISSQLRGRRQLLLHRQSDGAAIAAVDGTRRSTADRVSRGAATASLHDRRDGGSARSSAHRVDDARGRRGFCHALATHQISVFASPPAGERISDSRAAKGERGISQRRYWEHTIRDESDFVRHIDYIHINPVKHGPVTRVRDWPYSSFHRMAKPGVYPED